MVFRCFFCATVGILFTALDLKAGLQHLRDPHSMYPNFEVCCGIRGCLQRLRQIRSLRSHIETAHHLLLERFIEDGPIELPPEPYLFPTGEGMLERACMFLHTVDYGLREEDQAGEGGEGVCDSESEWDQSEDSEDWSEDDENDLPENDDVRVSEKKERAAMYAARLELRSMLPLNVKQAIIEETAAFTDNTLLRVGHILEREVQGFCEDNGLSQQQQTLLIDRLQHQIAKEMHPFEGMDTQFLRDKYVAHKFPFVAPQRHVLGETLKTMVKGNKHRRVLVEDDMYIIPLIKQLEVLFQNKVFFERFIHGPSFRYDGKLQNIFDGHLFKTHQLFSKEVSSIILVFYYDELELCNPIGSKKGVHKLGMFYYTIRNLPPEYQSSLSSIYLYAIVLETHLKMYGIDRILSLLNDELQMLSTGHDFETHSGSMVKLQGALFAFMADTPASHLLGGFKEGVGLSFKKCRRCDCDEVSMQQCFSSNQFHVRTLKEHLIRCKILESASSSHLQKHYSKAFGINRKSVLCHFPHFDITQQMPQDIMHIFLEGILPHNLRLFLQYCIKDAHIFTLDAFNDMVKSFPLGSSQKSDLPSSISHHSLECGGQIIENASKMWLLCRIVPFIIQGLGDFQDCPYWNNFHKLLFITHVVMSQIISFESIAMLSNMIEDYLSSYKELYHIPLTPKQHYLVHIPDQLFLFGPLIKLWCMRYEAKHRIVKQIARVSNNFKNICKTVSYRHQHLLATNLMTDNSQEILGRVFSKENHFGGSSILSQEEIEIARQQLEPLLPDMPFHHVTSIASCKWVEHKGVKFIAGETVVVTKYDEENDLPIFGEVHVIWVLNGMHIILRVLTLVTNGFDEVLLSFIVKKPHMACLLEPVLITKLLTLETAHIIKHKEYLYLNFKSYLLDLM